MVKIIEYLSQLIRLDKLPFSFTQRRSITDTIFRVRQLQEKYLSKTKQLYLAFINPEESFDRMSCCVIWWSVGRLGIDKQLVKVVQAMYRNTQ